jgi:hypothetical protein
MEKANLAASVSEDHAKIKIKYEGNCYTKVLHNVHVRVVR